MFDYQNQYNTPARQMERLKEAGLNPALMYGQGTTGNAQGFPQQAPAQQLNVAGAKSLDTALTLAQIKNINANTDEKKGLTPEARARISKLVADKNLISQQALKTAQETGNLVTTGEILDLDREIRKLEKNRNKKGFIKGDTIGNIVTMLGYDPVNNKLHRDILRGMFTVKFGSQVAKDLIQAFMSFRKPSTTINKAPSYPTINNYGGTNPFNSVKPKG
jgi:hypothetical protein